MQRYALSRIAATLSTSLAVLAAGLPSAFSPEVLGRLDGMRSDTLLPLASIALLIYVGWVLPRSAALESAALRSPRIARGWLIAVRYVAPAALAVLLAWRALSMAG